MKGTALSVQLTAVQAEGLVTSRVTMASPPGPMTRDRWVAQSLGTAVGGMSSTRGEAASTQRKASGTGSWPPCNQSWWMEGQRLGGT